MTDVFNIFFKKFAYKFPKGYPDMNNEQDILLLESLLENLGLPKYNTLLINEAASDIKDVLIVKWILKLILERKDC